MALIIIRLQNLPWEANSQDIRRFFEGLSIPEGGVHIVGGDRGDAFIAFSSDEDARQAMAKDGQEIKGIKVKLLLSSNNEMQKIVEQARQAHLTMMSRTQLPVVPNVLPAQVVVKPQDAAKKTPDVVVIKDEAARKRSRSRSRERRRSRSRDRKRDRSRDRKRSRSRSRERNGRNRGGRRRSRSRSRDRRDRVGRDRRRSDDTKDGNSSRDALPERDPSVLSESNDTPVWEPGMQPGAGLGNTALSFMGLPALAGLPANFTNLLQGMHGGLPVNPLVMAQALAQTAAVQQSAVPALPGLADIATPRATVSPAVALPTVPKIASLKNALLPTPEATPARKATPPPPSNLPVFPMFKNQSTAGATTTSNTTTSTSASNTSAPTTATTNGNGLSIETLHFRMSGMQQLPNYIDVKHFFCGVSLPNGSIRFKWESRVPVIYINVKDLDDAKIVQRLEGELLGQTPVHMKSIDRIEFLKGEEFYVETQHQMDSLRFNRPGQGLVLGGRAKPIEQDLVVVIIGIPFEVTEQDVKEFLNGINVKEIFIEYNQAGHSVGHCFAKLASHNDLELALGQCGHRIKHRNVEVLVANQVILSESKELYEKKRRPGGTGSQRPPRNHEKRPSRFSNIDDPPTPAVAPPSSRFILDSSKTVLSIHGLPFDIVDRQIGEMCAELGVKVNHIHIKNGSNPLEPSCAFVECQNAEDAAVVANMSGQPYYGYTLTIEAVTKEYMRNSMNIPIPAPPIPPFGMPPMGPQGFDAPGAGPFRGRVRGRGRSGGRGNHGQFPMNGTLPYPAPGPGSGMGCPMSDAMGGAHNGGNVIPPSAKPPLPELPILSPTDPFANPQCVVAICNLNYAAGVEDLIEVFKDYNIRKDLIMRRYNEQNQPTGDARVAFANPQDATEAVKRFNGTQLLGRTLRLTLLSR
ncbi:RNA-binding protein-like [Tropilaelaps mercedesae]|uniref:RNA-binding protein-like n=1 Tax=Tropilaelaps mercedesae TaxID=418985 RepID=A0A1V9WZK1_9ACAR|nr:RNA-binding protein-like [Tropilaelaps mercedesae]